MIENVAWYLPVEQWQHVLKNVTPKDLCNVMLASKYMNSVATFPNLWAGMEVNMAKVMENGLTEMFSIARYKKIKQLDFSDMDLSSEELQKIAEQIPGSPLKEINWSSNNFFAVPKEVVAMACCRLQIVNISYTNMLTDQSIQVLEGSLSCNTLINIDISGVDLSSVPCDLLAKAVCRLEIVNLSYTSLRTDQCFSVFEYSLSCDKLIDVDVTGIDLSKVPSKSVANAVSRFQTVYLHYTRLTTDQCINVLEGSLATDRLINVDLTTVNLSVVPGDLLARAVRRLQTVNLSYTRLTTDQSIRVLEASLFGNTLINIDMAGISLIGVPLDLLYSAVNRLQNVILRDTNLTADHCAIVVNAIISSTTLQYVNLLGNNIKQKVPATLLDSLPNDIEILIDE